MATQSLLNAQVDKAAKTLALLDGAGLDIRAAYWLFDDETQTWRFTIAEPEVDVRGTRVVYERISRALQGSPEALPLREIYVISPEDPLLRLVQLVVSTPGMALDGIVFSGNAIKGTRIPDMYIYRMYKPPFAATAP